ncbi:hypothetical protein SELMODRAFT_94465, partial [Selaginella moellendorffii]
QVHGYLNTHNGRAGCIAQLKRKFLPEASSLSSAIAGSIESTLSLSKFVLQLLTSLDVGARYDTDHKEFTYDVRGKKTLPLTDNGLLSVDLKGGFNFNPRLKLGKARGAIELSYKVFNFTEDQDLKLKIGYDPFKQARTNFFSENNWTFNADINGAWNIIYDL